MSAIYTYGQWIDIVDRGTSGDQVMDILASWKVDAYKLLEDNHKLEAELARRDEKIAEFEAMINPASFRKFLVEQIKDPELAEAYVKACIQDTTYKELLARRDEIITRLKEDAERLASEDRYEDLIGGISCRFCDECGGYDSGDKLAEKYFEHDKNCPITLHRALMKELE